MGGQDVLLQPVGTGHRVFSRWNPDPGFFLHHIQCHQILRLTGATNTFIRIPFLLEGVVLGFIGGFLSLILLLILIKLFPLYLGASLGVLNEFINFRYLTLPQTTAILIAGGITGLLGSITSLARFLKI
jgi:cell division transport system permease protein